MHGGVLLTLCDRHAIQAIILDFTDSTTKMMQKARLYRSLEMLQQSYALLSMSPLTRLHHIPTFHPTDHWATFLQRIQWRYAQCETLVITNNRTRTAYWHARNYSTIYVYDDGKLNFSPRHAPDEAWKLDDLEQFAQHASMHKPFTMENIGQPTKNAGKIVHMHAQNPITHVKYDVAFLGRFFQTDDARHYAHPLSRALPQLRATHITSPSRSALFDHFGRTVRTIVQSLGDVSVVTAVPPRPGQQHRFFGFKSFYRGTVPLKLDILATIAAYKRPKHAASFEEKYACVANMFTIQQEVTGHVVLLDDLYDSGATASECVRMLLQAGAERVTVIPIAYAQAKSADHHILNGAFDVHGHEFKLTFQPNSGRAVWARKEKGGYLLHADVFKKYVAQNRPMTAAAPLGAMPTTIDAVLFDLHDTLIDTTSLQIIHTYQQHMTNETIFLHAHVLLSRDVLAALRQAGIQVGIVTQGKREEALDILRAYQYDFDVLVSRDDCERTKPFGDPYICAMRKLNVQTERVLAIGNNAIDSAASMSASLHTIEIGRTHTVEEVVALLQQLTD